MNHITWYPRRLVLVGYFQLERDFMLPGTIIQSSEKPPGTYHVPGEPTPLAEVVGKKTKVVGSFQRAVKTVVVSSSQRHGNIALAECLKVLCLLRLDYMQWPYPSLI